MAKNPIQDEPPTPEQIKNYCLWISKGAIPTTAAARIGITERTLQRWLKAGEAGQKGFVEFAKAADFALIEFECRLLTFICDNAAKNVNAAQWLFMQRFGLKYKKAAEAEVGVEEDVKREAPILSTEELEAIEKRILDSVAKEEEKKPRNFGLQ